MNLLWTAEQIRDADPAIRLGQSIFIALAQLDVVTAATILDTDLDPFYLDDRVGPLLDWLERSKP